jgi:hypothetical protein
VGRIAALFVEAAGVYADLPGVDVWHLGVDARLYRGPWPVVAHPPCERWGRYYFGGPEWLRQGRPRKLKGDDGGCFASALWAVRTFGGVLEHPCDSAAWEWFGLARPPRGGGWIKADRWGSTCCVEQLRYGHRAQKATWLYVVGAALPELAWGKSPAGTGVTWAGKDRRRVLRTGMCQRLCRSERLRTPVAFRDVLLGIARAEGRG